MKNLKIIILAVLLTTIIITGAAKLSEETKEIVEDLRWKHYPFFYTIDDDIEWTWEQSYPYISFEGGTLYVTTQDGKWFIEMEKLKR